MTRDRLYGKYEVTTIDSDGEEITTDVIEGGAKFTIEDLKQYSLLQDLDEIVIKPLQLEIRNGDTVKHRFEVEHD